MGLETIIGGIIAAVVAVIAAFATGNYRGKTKATADATVRFNELETKRVVESNNKAMETITKASDNAAKINSEVADLPVGDALSELRRDYARDKDRSKNS